LLQCNIILRRTQKFLTVSEIQGVGGMARAGHQG